ncbi:MAG TPA: ATP-binding protein [Geobacteraceae bacterium]
MLIQFTVDNFRSIKDPATFSSVSGTNNNMNTFTGRGYTLLSSAVIYGANASGKSNILKAFGFMRSMVLNSRKVIQSTDNLSHEPFRLSTETESASSSFEVTFIAAFSEKPIKFRYGFEADSNTVYSEWLFADEKGKEAKLFFRDVEEGEFYVNLDKFREGKGLKDKVLKNHLFLWKCDQNGGEISKTILRWFQNLNLLDGIKHSDYMAYTLQQMSNTDFSSQIIKLVSIADLGIQDVLIEENEIPATEFERLSLPKELIDQIRSSKSPIMEVGIKAIHNKYDENQNIVGTEKFDMENDESEGTKKYFGLSAPFIDTLMNGKILLIDELDASLHPMLTISLISMFNNPKINTKNAQLIFATHDTNLLNLKLFHKSQIWFTEKDTSGATHLHSLVEYKNIRSTDNIEKHYIQGKYGAIPYIGAFSFEDQE